MLSDESSTGSTHRSILAVCTPLIFHSIAMSAQGSVDAIWRGSPSLWDDEVEVRGIVVNHRSGCLFVRDIRADSRSADVRSVMINVSGTSMGIRNVLTKLVDTCIRIRGEFCLGAKSW